MRNTLDTLRAWSRGWQLTVIGVGVTGCEKRFAANVGIALGLRLVCVRGWRGGPGRSETGEPGGGGGRDGCRPVRDVVGEMWGLGAGRDTKRVRRWRGRNGRDATGACDRSN